MTPTISYLVTTKNDTFTLLTLLIQLESIVNDTDDELVIVDDFSTDERVLAKLNDFSKTKNIRVLKHALNNDYGGHKNWGIEQCKNDWIFQIDADEIPAEATIGDNLREIIKSNPNTELFYVPRINHFVGVTKEHAKKWGWNIDNPNSWINWNTGDYQTRIFKRDYPRIRWENKLHERIVGFKEYGVFPKQEDFALYHYKTIEVQEATNERYNKDFSAQENKGISDKR
jgi:glycosyltransferase involved in cell wall biosynthesis